MTETPPAIQRPPRTRMPRRWVANGAAIRSLREKDGYSQEQFAGAVGLTQQNISLIENGTRFPRPQTLRRIADQLRVPVAAITRDAAEDTEAS